MTKICSAVFVDNGVMIKVMKRKYECKSMTFCAQHDRTEFTSLSAENVDIQRSLTLDIQIYIVLLVRKT